MELPNNAPPPRLCHILKWDDFDGFGFNLHGDKTKPGQYIGKVDSDSPAEAGGLLPRDRIIEVNGTNISNENHKQVVERIKAVSHETILLVLDEKAEEFYKSRNILVSSTMPNVVRLKTPERKKSKENGVDKVGEVEETQGHLSNGSNHVSEVRRSSIDNGVSKVIVEEIEIKESDEERELNVSESGSVGSSSTPSNYNSLKKENGVERGSISPTPSPTPLIYSSSNSSMKGSNNSLDLNMTAKEMRAKLAARKKYDAKSEKIDLRKKYDIIQTL